MAEADTPDSQKKKQKTGNVTPQQSLPMKDDLLVAPPQRIFPELPGFVQYQRRDKGGPSLVQVEMETSAFLDEQAVVETVDKYRKGVLHKEKTVLTKSDLVKKDNIPVDEVVMIINDQRAKMIRSYKKYTGGHDCSPEDTINKHLSPKIKELKVIFEEHDVIMEWERIT